MDRWRNRIAVVTGASSGIGAAIVKDLVQAEFIVVGLARRKDLISELRQDLPSRLHDRLYAVRCDVSDIKSVNDAFDWIIKKLGGVDILVCNAGIHTPGQLLTMDTSVLQQMVQTNLMGVVYCIQRAFDSMKQRDFDGHILVINSILGHKVLASPRGTLPILNIYPSTKFGISAMVEVIRQELNAFGTHIKITSISPGIVDTDILPESFNQLKKLNPKDISAGVMYAILTEPNAQVHELTIKPIGELF